MLKRFFRLALILNIAAVVAGLVDIAFNPKASTITPVLLSINVVCALVLIVLHPEV